MSGRLCGVAVLYHPRMEMLQRLVATTRHQIDWLYVIDNTPGPGVVPAALSESDRLTYLRMGSNVGLAAAQNIGLRHALEDGDTHVLLLDQDSELAEHAVDRLLEAEEGLLASGQRVAAVGAMYVDIKTNLPGPSHRYHPFRLEKIHVSPGSEPIQTDWLIASGSMIRCSVFRVVGLMREELFIDLVDTEWGLRARSMGFASFLVPKATMRHSIGDKVVRLLGRKLTIHNDVRCCYMLRNNAYLLRCRSMGWRWRSYVPLNLLYSFLTSTWTAEDRLRRARLLLWAIWRGFRGQGGPLPQFP